MVNFTTSPSLLASRTLIAQDKPTSASPFSQFSAWRKNSKMRQLKNRNSKLELCEPVTISSHQNCSQSEFQRTGWSFCNRRNWAARLDTSLLLYDRIVSLEAISSSQCTRNHFFRPAPRTKRKISGEYSLLKAQSQQLKLDRNRK